MINRVVLVGRMTKNPELRYTPNGVAVSNFTLAVNNHFSKDKEADFIQCVIWKKQAENTANYTHKGSLVGVEGRIQTRTYDGNDGKRQYITEVVCDSIQFLEPKNDKPQQNPQKEQPFDNDPFANDGKPINISDDDLPF